MLSARPAPVLGEIETRDRVTERWSHRHHGPYLSLSRKAFRTGPLRPSTLVPSRLVTVKLSLSTGCRDKARNLATWSTDIVVPRLPATVTNDVTIEAP